MRIPTAALALALAGLGFTPGGWAAPPDARVSRVPGVDGLMPPFLTGPYQDVTQGWLDGGPRFGSPPWLGAPAAGRVLLWAFAGGECGAERWGTVDGEAFARENVAAAERSGQDFIVSTGGEAAMFTCGSDAGMRRFVERYRSPRLVGIDFDIEGRQTPAQIHALARRARFVQRHWPHLRLSFTLATHAGSDAVRRGLNATGKTVLAALRGAGVRGAVINLMVMNYGPAEAAWCVPAEPTAAPRCDMARSALQAAHNLHHAHGVPYARIALTLMTGENDVAGNLTTLEDAHQIAREARARGLAGVHHWSVHRDQACPAGEPRVSPRCHGLAGLEPGAFGQALQLP